MEEAGTAAHVLTLFDVYWFHRQILRPSPPSPLPTPLPPLLDREDAESHSSEPPPAAHPSLHLRRHRRSLSDEADASVELRIQTPKLRTILSGKEAPVEDLARRNGTISGSGEIWTAAARRRRPGNRRGRSSVSSRSLSELEFEEVKGFMDLGFTFSDAEADPRLMSIVPGLQRMGKRTAGDGELAEEGSSCASDVVDESSISRPYLSEAWDAQEEEEENMLRNWRIPAAADGVDLKDHLRFWAHAVASTVR